MCNMTHFAVGPYTNFNIGLGPIKISSFNKLHFKILKSGKFKTKAPNEMLEILHFHE